MLTSGVSNAQGIGARFRPVRPQTQNPGATTLAGSPRPQSPTPTPLPTAGSPTLSASPSPSPTPAPTAPSAALTNTAVLPGGDPRLTASQGATDTAAAGVQGAPSVSSAGQGLYGQYRSLLSGGQTRFDAAKGTLQNLDETQALARQKGIRSIGQAAATLGRTGAGMTTNDLTGLEQGLNDTRERTLRDLSAATTEGDINDRFRTLDTANTAAGNDTADRYRRLNAAQDLEGQQFGQGEANRNEYRTERGYQTGEDQRSLDNALTVHRQEGADQGSAFDRALATAQVGASNPDAVRSGVLNSYDAAVAGGTQGSQMSAFEQELERLRRQQQGAPGGDVPIPSGDWQD